jgi:hypothetical protein
MRFRTKIALPGNAGCIGRVAPEQELLKNLANAPVASAIVDTMGRPRIIRMAATIAATDSESMWPPPANSIITREFQA